MKRKTNYKVKECVPYQLCPKCGGVGTITKKENNGTSIISYPEVCDVCYGEKIIPMHVIVKAENQDLPI